MNAANPRLRDAGRGGPRRLSPGPGTRTTIAHLLPAAPTHPARRHAIAVSFPTGEARYASWRRSTREGAIARFGQRLALAEMDAAAPPPRPPAREAEVLDLTERADLDAVRRTLAGDAEAFAGVVRRHARRLVSLCGRMVNDVGLGEELAQEALARAFGGLSTFRGDCRFRHWLYRIAANGCRDFLKAGARAERASDLTGDELVSGLDPERDAAARQAVTALAGALAALPEKYREAFTLFHVDNLDYEEIAAVTGVRANALKVRVHRARLMLRARLGELLEAQ